MRCHHALGLTLGLGLTGLLHAEPELEPEAPVRYVVGLAIGSSPEYSGARAYQTQLQPVWAAHWGRWRLSTAGGSGLLGFGRAAAGPGASTELFTSDRLKLGFALRIDGGRDSDKADNTRGLPDVRKTLRGRVFASLQLTPHLDLGSAWSHDLLGRGGGGVADLDLRWRFHRSETLEWSAWAGLSAANASYQRGYFGVDPASAAATGRPAYEPGAGLRDLHLGVGFTQLFGKHWMAFGSTGMTRLAGPSADSSLVQRKASGFVGLGLAWRN